MDTSALRGATPFARSAFSLLAELGEAGALELHLHQIVIDETVVGLARDLGRVSQREFGRIAGWLHEEEARTRVDAADRLLHDLSKHAEMRIRAGMNALLEKPWVIHEDIGSAEAANVFAGYFQGAAPFTSRSARKDLPDAFILEGLRQLAGRLDEVVYVIVADNNLRKHASQVKGVRAFEHLSHFIQDKDVKARTEELRSAVARARLADSARRSMPEIHSRLEEAVVDDLLHAGVELFGFPGSVHHAQVDEIGDLRLTFDFEQAEPLSGLELFMQFVADSDDARLDVYTDKSSYWGLDELERERYAVVADDVNDYMMIVQAAAQMQVSGTAVVRFDPATFQLAEVAVDSLDDVEFVDLRQRTR
ncbi:MAG: PIN domain-containing protein [Myxococcota bacterium]